MNDPLSSLTAPPPRYLLESDSSDEEGQGNYPNYNEGESSKPKIRLNNDLQVSIDGIDGQELNEVITGIGQSGKCTTRLTHAQRIGNVKIGQKITGHVYRSRSEKISIISLEESDLNHEEIWELIKALIEKVKAKKWIIITSYVPSMYIPSSLEQSERNTQPPTRILSTSSAEIIDGIRGFDAPNYLTGIAGGIVSLASHPSTSSILQPKTILLPLPLSSLSSSQMSSALQAVSSSLSDDLGQAGRPWTEDDDEPYAAPGMGRVKGLHRGVGEVSSMYM
ncbi:uncharacterized protein I206_105907 [Kwoniella pini CBS 10737]|uniref:Uncharacterized protein n=1 Tax=Kwoniella pini CBS 10737 TaxID=1296096 RepID=A0A1B9I0H6_9TREE|nr:uncharacterized protein I206_04730 [Kwoniella pini CBS 10737]OCF49043.1 hypothetical protein I206_04730 [Kwoniella pini CBS 10737]